MARPASSRADGGHRAAPRMRRIATARLVLEPQTAAHAAQMFDVLADPAIYAYENEPPPSLAWLAARFAKLESRRSADGREQWLNWVLRPKRSVPGGAPPALIGFVQATVRPDRSAAIAYVLGSAHWGRGLAQEAVAAMLARLAAAHDVALFTATLKSANERSLRLLERLSFAPAGPELAASHAIEPDETLMWRAA